MIRKLVIGAAGLVALFLVTGSHSPTSEHTRATSASKPDEANATTFGSGARRMPLVGATRGPRVSWWMQGGTLVRVDPHTFRPLPHPRIELGFHGYSWSYSPDRSKLVLGGFASGLRFVDLNRFRQLGDLRENRRGGLVLAVTWPRPRRVLAVVQEPWGGGPLTLATVDPIKRTVLGRRSVSNRTTVVRTTANRLGLFLLLAPRAGIGPAKLLFVDARGAARTVVLARVRAGQVSGRPSTTGRVNRWWGPDLTLDLAGRRAFVVGGAAPVAEIDLRTMRVTYHELREPISFLGQLRNWLEPAAQAKGETAGPVRYARWLGDGRLAVSGFDARGKTPSSARGLKVIDTHTWAVRTLDRKAGDFVSTQRLLLAYGSWVVDGSLGLTAYDKTGKALWHLFRRRPIHAVQVREGRAYVRLEGTWGPRGPVVTVVDLRKGKVLRTVRAPWTQLLLPQESSMAEKES